MKKILFSIAVLLLVFSASVFVYADSNQPETAGASCFVMKADEICGLVVNRFNNLFRSGVSYDYPEAEKQKDAFEKWDKGTLTDAPGQTLKTETWKITELTFISDKNYADPFNDVDVDLILVGNGRKYTVPGFWNGGNEWKVRFVCPSEGTWQFITKCTDEGNESLNNRTGEVICSLYSGGYDIYSHGFVTTKDCKKYLTYDDGTPFAYLGDTHWSLGGESAGMVKTIAEKRYNQGFTVIQSEPIDAKFDFSNGITEDDIPGLAAYDENFAIIAENGLVHADSEFFFPSSMESLVNNFGGYENGEVCPAVKTYLEKISRYWVARYSAYPVLWTLGQEVDNDFYGKSQNVSWTPENNPYKLVAEYIDKYDPYDHPITAHQEYSGSTAAFGNGKGTDENLKVYCEDAEPSAFRKVRSHSWYAVQWSPSKTNQCDFNVPKDYWYNSQGKPALNYEGQYCGLWTKNFGARMQGWCAFLNGLYGYGWGGHDTWSYLNIYDEANDSDDGVDVITSAEKIEATWETALEYESSYQSGYMLRFMKNIEWFNLIPRFDDKTYFAPSFNVYYCMASNVKNTEGVVYFYSFTDKSVAGKANAKKNGGVLTGTIGNLEPETEYKYQWFNPITGEYSDEYSFTSSKYGTFYIGQRQWNGSVADCDMVFYYHR